MPEVTIRLRCGKCGNRFSVSINGDTWRETVACRCPWCGAVHHVRIDINVHVVDVSKKDLEDFERWLRKKGLLSAREYMRIVRRRLEDPNYLSRTQSPYEYFVQFIEEKYGKDKAREIAVVLGLGF